ncbi:MAG: hypothetical protein AAB458_00410 [Patescibacteria group bacterium]
MVSIDVARLAELAALPSRYDRVYEKVSAAFDDLCQNPQLSWQGVFLQHGLPINTPDLKVSLSYRSEILETLTVEGRIDGVDFVGHIKHVSNGWK